MKDEIKIIAMVLGTIVLVVSMLVSYNLYTNYKSRELYAACLEKQAEPKLSRFGVTCYAN